MLPGLIDAKAAADCISLMHAFANHSSFENKVFDTHLRTQLTPLLHSTDLRLLLESFYARAKSYR